MSSQEQAVQGVEQSTPAATEGTNADAPRPATPEGWRVALERNGTRYLAESFGRERDGAIRAQVRMERNGAAVTEGSVRLTSLPSRKQFARDAAAPCEGLRTAEVEGDLIVVLDAARQFLDQPVEVGAAQVADPLGGFPEGIRKRAEGLLKNPEILDELCSDLRQLGVVGEELVALLTYFVAVSRKLLKPLALIVSGAASTGKSFVIETVLRLIPPEEVDIATDRTLQSLCYKRPDALRHMLVVTKEQDRQSEGNQALRELLSAGDLIKDTVVKDPLTGRFTTEKLRLEGPIAYVETTTEIDTNDEDATRMIQAGSARRPVGVRARGRGRGGRFLA
jgi:hypothetical protein